MISEEAQKSIKRYSSLGSLIKALYFNPSKDAKIRVMFQRLNYNFALKFNPKLKDANYEELYLGGIRTLKITTPKSDPNKNILYFHGGAYIVGNPEAYKSLVGHLAGITEATIYVPDYRLAPENKFPSQLNDGVECYKALINENRNSTYPQFSDHYFTGDYPIKPQDKIQGLKIKQLSLLSGKSNS